MSRRHAPRHGPKSASREADALVHALQTNQVDAIVGRRHVMVVRLRQAEEALERSRDELRALAAGLQIQREQERAAIAREIHDELGQALTSLQLGLSWIARTVPATERPVRAKLGLLSELVTNTMRSVRKIALELRPGVVDELGLVQALRSEARAFEEHTGIRCRCDANLGTARLDRAGSVAMFRIAQAALTNVARHARASRAAIAVTRQNRDLVLTVTDNGKGIGTTAVRHPEALGIVGMQERAIALGGTCALTGSPGAGTTLTVRIPLSRVLINRVATRARRPGSRRPRAAR